MYCIAMHTNQEYYLHAIDHRNSHKCGGYPFAQGTLLCDVVKTLGATSVLEIGTAIGYSAFSFATNNPEVNITTIDLIADHKDLAEKKWSEHGVANQITCVTGDALDVLPTLTETYDIIFFDGFAPDPKMVRDFVRLLGADGVLISSNLSWNDSAEQYLATIGGQGLATTQMDDTSFSSRDSARVALCAQLWK